MEGGQTLILVAHGNCGIPIPESIYELYEYYTKGNGLWWDSAVKTDGLGHPEDLFHPRWSYDSVIRGSLWAK